MHTFVYPNKNSYITNESGYDNSNFSLDSLLEIKSVNSFVPVQNYYITQSISSSTYTNVCGANLYAFTGIFDGRITKGTINHAIAYVSGSAIFSTDKYNGYYNGNPSLISYSGSLSGSVSGSVDGTFSGSIDYISGSFVDFTGSCFSGSIFAGTGSIYSPYLTYDHVSVKSRALMLFDLSEISKSIANGDLNSGSLKYYLRLSNSTAKELPLSYNIIAYPLINSWELGDGRYSSKGSTTGVSWNYRDYYNGTTWNDAGGYYMSSSNYTAYQSFNHTNSDIKMDITNIAKEWTSGSITNYGLILLTSLESSSVASNNALSFFSTETNTIYSPYLDVYWDDSVHNTGSLSSSTYPYNIVIQNLKGEYKFGNIPRINVYSKQLYPLKNFTRGTQMSQYITSSYLPVESYYSVKDNESEEVLIDFDEGTKLSCDGNINYFMMDTTAFPQERYYRILIKTIDSNGSVNIFDNKNIFKIVR